MKKVKSPLSAVPAPHPPKKIEGVTAKASTRNRSKEETWEEYFNKLKAYKVRSDVVLLWSVALVKGVSRVIIARNVG